MTSLGGPTAKIKHWWKTDLWTPSLGSKVPVPKRIGKMGSSAVKKKKKAKLKLNIGT